MPVPFTLVVSPRLRSTPFHERVLAAGVKASDWGVSRR